jgi:catechol 2,3-dioxygenase-like lactoylglutathione lyase family enzyme
MLTVIVAVTLAVPDLGAIEQAYGRYFDYRVVDRGVVTREVAEAWGATALINHPYMLMQPASGEPVYLRVVQQEPVEGYEPMRTLGWNSNEILVEDSVKLHEQLKDSPFRIIGPPKPLNMSPSIVAMQAIGPANELVYLTRIPPGGSSYNLGTAKSWVDRTFIVVLGGSDMEAMRRFYGEALGMPTTEPRGTPISVINDAYGLPADYKTLLGIVRLPSSFLIELDQYPPMARIRPQRQGELPPGIAMVSFGVKSLDDVKLPFVAPPRRLEQAPYSGRRAAVVRGAAGELVELIE